MLLKYGRAVFTFNANGIGNGAKISRKPSFTNALKQLMEYDIGSSIKPSK